MADPTGGTTSTQGRLNHCKNIGEPPKHTQMDPQGRCSGPKLGICGGAARDREAPRRIYEAKQSQIRMLELQQQRSSERSELKLGSIGT